MRKIIVALLICLPIYMAAQNTPKYIGTWVTSYKLTDADDHYNVRLDVPVRQYIRIELNENNKPIVLVKEVENGGMQKVWYWPECIVSSYDDYSIKWHIDRNNYWNEYSKEHLIITQHCSAKLKNGKLEFESCYVEKVVDITPVKTSSYAKVYRTLTRQPADW